MSVTRYRCTQCKKLVELDACETKVISRERPVEGVNAADYLFAPLGTYETTIVNVTLRHHRVMRSQAAGGGRIGCRTYMDKCGPVEPEVIDDYIDQLEHFIGETT